MKCPPFFLIFTLLLGLLPGSVVGLETPIVFTQAPAHKRGELCGDGSRLVVFDPANGPTVITPEFSSACDPDVSFDGRRVLFAGKSEPADPFNIFELGLDGEPARQLTRDMGDCREPLYLPKASVTAPLFDDLVPWMAFTSTAHGGLNEGGDGPLTSLYVTNLDPIKGRGTVVWRTTYGLGGDFSPTVLLDGRVLFSSHQAGQVKMMTVTWAGDNLNLFRPGKSENVQSMACEMPGKRSVVLVESDRPDRGGRLTEISLRRPLHLHEILSTDTGRYLTPHPTSDGRILVSYANGATDYGIYLFDREASTVGTTIFDDPDWNDVDAIELAPHPEPLARIPMLEFASVLDIEGFEDAGQLHCMSVYDSDQEAIQKLEPGSVKWARFIQGVPLSIEDQERCRSTADERDWPPPCVETRILGEAPVEKDGSFFVNITGNIPFFIELLDKDRKTLHSMESWIWIRSKSQRGCIGCHENKELSPQNRATDALIKMQPTFVGTESPATEEPRLISSHAQQENSHKKAQKGTKKETQRDIPRNPVVAPELLRKSSSTTDGEPQR